jgi:hypothetical protein
LASSPNIQTTQLGWFEVVLHGIESCIGGVFYGICGRM